jgi:hypothetical protein
MKLQKCLDSHAGSYFYDPFALPFDHPERLVKNAQEKLISAFALIIGAPISAE